MTYPDNYLEALDYLIGIEGSPTNHAWDPGGETAYGIAKAFWPQYWADGQPDYEIAKLFYWKEFWKPMRLGELRCQALRLELFEAGVNCGAATAIKFAQHAYNLLSPRTWAYLKPDGIIGPKTLRAINRMTTKYPDALLAGCNYFQAEYYVGRNLTVRENAIRGWFAKRLAWRASA